MVGVEKIAIRFDEDNLTLGDLEDFEDAAGVSLFEALKPVIQRDDEGKIIRDEKGRPEKEVNLSAKGLKALVWVVLRAERPGFSLDDARAIKVTALEMVETADESGNVEGQSDEGATA